MIQPDLLYTVLCDEVRREDNGKWILLGLFEQISTAGFPSQHPTCCIVNKWCNGEGNYSQQTRFVDHDDRILLQSESLAFELVDLDATFTAVQMFSGLILERAGKIWVEILLDGELKQRYPLRVSAIGG
ncbi:MAG TPA: hypothetical protein VGB45_04865 [Abditibacterium sp.]|jgi:hypothetical protein